MSKFVLYKGDMLRGSSQVLVNPVNIIGVMGAGLAAQFKRRYPEMFLEYLTACRSGTLKIGTISHHHCPDGKVVICLPTKTVPAKPSEYSYVAEGLMALYYWLTANPQVGSIAVPPLGCGLGRLDRTVVAEMVQTVLEMDRDLEVRLYNF